MKAKIVLFLTLSIFTLGSISSSGRQEKELILGVMIIDKEIASWLNQHLEDGDWVGIWFGKFKKLAPITNQKLIRTMTGGNYSRIVKNLQGLKRAKVDVIWYDLEPGHKEITQQEIDDPVKYTQLLKEFCLENKFKLGVAPSLKIIQKYGSQLARQVDYFLFMSGSAQERLPQEFRKEMIRRINMVKSSNPNLKIFVQLRTFHQKNRERQGRFSAGELMEYVEAIQNYADGITLIYSKETLDVMKEFVLFFKRKY
jgi:hypothetical protein